MTEHVPVSTSDWMPNDVREVADLFLNATGVPSVITTTGTGFRKVWHLEMANDRVRMKGSLRPGTKPSRYHWAGSSSLTVDGVPHPFVEGLAELGELFADPDAYDRSREVATPQGPRPVPTTGTIEDAPPVVRMAYTSIAARANAKLSVSVGNAADCWVIGLDTDRAVLRIVYRSRAAHGWALVKDFWSLDGDRPIELFVDGQDHTDKVQGKLDQALAMALNPGEMNAGSPQITHTAASPRSNAVETRRATVIRN